MPGENERLVSAAVWVRADVAGVATLPEELLNHAQRNTVTAGGLIAGTFPVIMGSQYPFA